MPIPSESDNVLGSIKEEELSNHPLAQRVFTIARNRGVELNDYSSLVKIIEQLDNEALADPKTIILLADLVERLMVWNRQIVTLKESKSRDQIGLSGIIEDDIEI